MEGILPIIGIGLGLVLFLIVIYFAIIAMFYKKIHQGQALIRTGFGNDKCRNEG